jgi:hypothetical protein
MHKHGAFRKGRDWRLCEKQVRRISRDPRFDEKPAPPHHFVFVRVPLWQPRCGSVRWAKGDEPARIQARQGLIALRATTVKVHCHRDLAVRLASEIWPCGGDHTVDRPSQRCKFEEPRPRGQHDLVVAEVPSQCPIGRYAGQEVTKAEVAKDQQQRAIL